MPVTIDKTSIDRTAAAAPARGGMLTRATERVGRRIVARALAQVQIGAIRVTDAHGEITSPGAREDADLVRVNDGGFYAAAAFGGALGVAEAYMDGWWTSPDLAGLIETMTVNWGAARSLEGPVARLMAPLGRAAYMLERNSRAGSRRNIRAHYDLGNELFALFLDPTMTYSCGIFENGARTLEEAQVEKIDRACRMLGLRAGDTLLEIGTGWGALAVHAAREYGCCVTSTTISDEQHAYATARVARAGLADRVQVVKCDYRDLTGTFDKVVSIEMIEAVGKENLGDYFSVVSDRLKPDGAALIQAIVIRDQAFDAAARRRDFLKKHIFPGSCLPSVKAMLDAVCARTDLRTWQIEDIGPHYVTTLRMWREAFMSRLDDVRRLGYDERFIRMWEYYLAYCEGVFRARHVGDVQMVLTKPLSKHAHGRAITEGV